MGGFCLRYTRRHMKQARIAFAVIAIVIIGMVVVFALGSRTEDVEHATVVAMNRDVTAQEFASIITNEPDRRVIDVRTASEYGAGHIPGAENIDFYGPGFVAQFADIDPETPLALYCHSGNRSAQAAGELEAAGFTNIVNLDGGIGAWQAMGGGVE